MANELEPKPPIGVGPPPPKGNYTPAEIQEWQTIHGTGSFPPGYVPKPSPTTRPEVTQDSLYQQRVAQQEEVKTVQNLQQQERQQNIQQQKYREQVSQRAYKQSESTPQTVKLPEQKTSTAEIKSAKEYRLERMEQIKAEQVKEEKPIQEQEKKAEPIISVKPTTKKTTVTLTESLHIGGQEPHEVAKSTIQQTDKVQQEKEDQINLGFGITIPIPKPIKEAGTVIADFIKGARESISKPEEISIRPETPAYKAGYLFPTLIGSAVVGLKGVGLVAKETVTGVRAAKGATDIGLNIAQKSEKATEQTREAERLANFNRDIASTKNKGPQVYQTRESEEFLGKTQQANVQPKFTETKIELGRGAGASTGKGTAGTSTITKPSAPTGPSKPPEGKEVTSKQGLVQIVKEKPEVKTETIKPTFKEYPISLGKSQVTLVKPKVSRASQIKTGAQLETEKYLQSVKQNRAKSRVKEDETTGLVYVVPQKAGTKEKEKSLTGLINITTTLTRQREKEKDVIGLVEITTPKLDQPSPQLTRQKTIPVPLLDLVIPTPKPTIPRPTPPPEKPPTPRKTPPPEKPTPPRKPPELEGLLPPGTSKAEKKRKAKGKKRQEFIGNVPLSSIVGVYKRSETTYGSNVISKLVREKGLKGKSSRVTHNALLGKGKKFNL